MTTIPLIFKFGFSICIHKDFYAFLEKELAGIHNKDFEGYKSKEELLQKKKNLLKINKIYDIKEVFDDDTFEQNHRVLKEVVELLQQYQIRYPRKQRHLSEFFEQLLTTGLKQEAGQYFTPPAITKFIVRSLPLPEMLKKEINQPTPSLPAALDYAAGSGHFITEILEEYQDIIENLDTSDFYPKAQKEMAAWKADPYNWASKFVYGIEKDYRLVKVAKVGCYFYEDGLVQIILGDGLDSFEKSKSYVGLLKENAKKPQFSVLVSNPPYSVDGVKDDLEYIGAQHEFTLFKNLTDNSSEIEALFVERAAQLLKENGIAGIVLPCSILSNGGIYAKTREIILQNFDIIAITQLGGNTFMATNTNTVVLFLRKRSETHVNRIKEAAFRIAENYPKTHEDLTINGIEKPVQKYLDYSEETQINPEKFYYFILNYHQKTVIVKTGDKEEEKKFLGYKIVKRRGNEGYHTIQSGKTIDECTRLFDDKNPENPEKASTYIYQAFNKKYPAIHETLKENVFSADLIDMLTFDRENFDKNISLAIKKKVKFESKWKLVKIGQIVTINPSKKEIADLDTDTLISFIDMPSVSNDGYITNKVDRKYSEIKKGSYTYFREGDIIIAKITPCMENGKCALATNLTNGLALGSSEFHVFRATTDKINIEYLFTLLNRKSVRIEAEKNMTGASSHKRVPVAFYENLQIPLPPKDIQEKLVAEMKVLEKKEDTTKRKLETAKENIEQLFLESYSKASNAFHLSADIFDVSIGKRVIEANLNEKGTIPVYSANVFEPLGYIDKYLITDFSTPSVLWGIDGDWMVNYIPVNKESPPQAAGY
jgi:type I restriction enzyme M protein